MIILEKPYVSEMLIDFLRHNDVPVLNNEFSCSIKGLNRLKETDFIHQYQQSSKLYTVSEYALEWIKDNLNDTELNNQIALLKNKASFRETCKNIHPDFFYKELKQEELHRCDISGIPTPFVLKPTIGFLSTGVHVIFNVSDWTNALESIERNFKEQADNFPCNVVAQNNFIIETYVEGKELAIDLYFDGSKPVIINIFEHLFESDKDVSDRLYITNKKTFDDHLQPVTRYISELNKFLNLKNIAIHLEIRINGNSIIPIEINPLRFTGLCLNEIHYYITGKHPLYYFMTNTTPCYEKMWSENEDNTFCFSILSKKCFETGDSEKKIEKTYSDILETRKVNNPDSNIAFFVFSKLRNDNQAELNRIMSL